MIQMARRHSYTITQKQHLDSTVNPAFIKMYGKVTYVIRRSRDPVVPPLAAGGSDKHHVHTYLLSQLLKTHTFSASQTFASTAQQVQQE